MVTLISSLPESVQEAREEEEEEEHSVWALTIINMNIPYEPFSTMNSNYQHRVGHSQRPDYNTCLLILSGCCLVW